MHPTLFDVAIIGGGLAGNFLARQLQQTLPHLTIAIFEKKLDTSFKVGESTVEVASNYMVRRLGLSDYLTQQQLPKNGLRFFFDQPTLDTPFTEMSELGGVAFPHYPSFQLDRSRFEADLFEMNQNNGVSIHRGYKVTRIECGIEPGNRMRHRFLVEKNSQVEEIRCRWIIDASGRRSLLAHHHRLRVASPTHPLSAVWGRCTGMADLDAWGPETFRDRIHHSPRHLSTNHFCYPGYWMWIIPLGRGVTSIGVVGERSMIWRDRIQTMSGFLAFLQQHQAIWALLASAQWLDVGSYQQLGYNTRQYFSEDGWGLTGEAASFTDPFYSPGSDFIALENDFLTLLIQHDAQGRSPQSLKGLAQTLNQYMHFRYEANMGLYQDQYSLLGSYELLKLKWQLDFPLYYHLWFSQYLQDHHLNEDFLQEQIQGKTQVLNALRNFSCLFRSVEETLRSGKDYYRHNSGHFTDALEGVDWVKEVGTPQAPKQTLTRLNQIFNRTYHRSLELMGRTSSPRSLSHFVTADAFV